MQHLNNAQTLDFKLIIVFSTFPKSLFAFVTLGLSEAMKGMWINVGEIIDQHIIIKSVMSAQEKIEEDSAAVVHRNLKK